MISVPEEQFIDKHIFRMTDDTGMLQHAKYAVPDPRHGYTSDDNARALLAAVMLFETVGKSEYLDLAYKYIGFLLYAWNKKSFRNFMLYNRNFIEEEGSEDCFGRCFWCLGYVSASTALPAGLRSLADYLLRKAVDRCGELPSLRAKAYTLLGLCLWAKTGTQETVRILANDLVTAFTENAEEEWPWFENKITYCNAVIPWALFEAYTVLGERYLLDMSLAAFDFLLAVTFRADVFYPVGCKGWLVKGGEAALYDQQPVEACTTMLAGIKAFSLTDDPKYLNYAEDCFAWYEGKNIAGVSLIDSITGGCKDGIEPQGLNKNEGAESLVAWSIAWATRQKIKKERSPI